MNGNWVKAALLASLAVNIFLIGLVGGEMLGKFRYQKFGGDPAASNAFGPRQLRGVLSAERRKELKPIFMSRREQWREQRKQLRAARLSLADALEQQPFDPGLVEDAMREMRDRSDAVKGTMQGAMLEMAAILTDDERQKLAAAIREGRKNRRRRGKDQGSGGTQ